MGAKDHTPLPGPDALEQAADWVDRLPDLTAAERAALDAWLKAAPAHAEAFGQVLHSMTDIALLAATRQVRGGEPLAAPRRRWTVGPVGLGLMAAALAMAVALPAWWVATRGRPAPAPAALELATAVGARSDYALADRSVAHLNADSSLSVLYSPSARDVRMHRGDAMFDVAKNAHRPFNVRANDVTVTAVGTSFEVDMLNDAVEVRVFDGVVRVAPQQAAAYTVRKGEWLRLAADHHAAGGPFAPDTYRTWRTDWLDAENVPLKYVVARLNRYAGNKIVLDSDAAANVAVTGRFRLSRTDDALSMISTLLDMDAVRRGDQVALKPARPAARRTPD